MAKNDLDINLKTKYQGEGLKKLEQGINNAGSKITRMGNSVKNITNALDTFGGNASSSVNKVTGAVGKLASGFATGGVLGVGIAAVTSAISWFKDKAEEAALKAKEAFENAFEAMKTKIEGIKNAVKDYITELKTANELAKAHGATVDSNAAKYYYNERKKALSQTDNEFEQKNINAEFDAKEKRLAVERLVKEAQRKRDEAQASYDSQSSATSKILVEGNAMLTRAYSAWQNGDVSLKSSKEAITEAQKQMKEAKQAEKAAKKALELADEELRNVESQAKLSLQKIEDTLNEALAKTLLEERETLEKAETKKADDTAKDREKLTKELIDERAELEKVETAKADATAKEFQENRKKEQEKRKKEQAEIIEEYKQKEKDRKELFEAQKKGIEEEIKSKEDLAKKANTTLDEQISLIKRTAENSREAFQAAANMSAGEIGRGINSGRFTLNADGSWKYSNDKNANKRSRQILSKEEVLDRLIKTNRNGSNDELIKRQRGIIDLLKGDTSEVTIQELEQLKVDIEKSLNTNISDLNLTLRDLISAYENEETQSL